MRRVPPVREDLDELGLSLARALRYVAAWGGQRVVLKFGGSAMDAGALGTLIEDVVELQAAGILPVLVHGGGPEISRRLEEEGLESRFIDGLRVTDERAMAIVEEVLAGSANRRLVESIEAAGGRAAGVGGHRGLLAATPHPVRELGFVGMVSAVDPGPVERLLERGVLPVIAPLASGPDGRPYNVNADAAAAALAGTLGAAKFMLLTDVPGVLSEGEDRPGERQLIAELTPSETEELIARGVVSRGMIPKVRACLDAVAAGVPRAHILAADRPHGVLVELFTQEGVGTLIVDRTVSPTIVPGELQGVST